MIIHCPACEVRLEHSAHERQAGDGVIHCRSCGHDWIEGKTIQMSAEPMRTVPVTIEHSALPHTDFHNLVSASLQAHEVFQMKRRRRRVRAAAWAALALLALSPAGAAIAMPERVVAFAPATISLYGWLGREINIYGLEIQDVELQHLETNGLRVIAVKGQIVNVSGSDRKIPWLRFGLLSDSNNEVYQWQIDTESRPLRPGEAKSFFTRIASPPETANSVEIRFARAEEIGSKAVP
jgi:hypothetical protein